MATDRKSALEVAREYNSSVYASCGCRDWPHARECANCTRLAALILAQRREAVEAAKPGIERAAKVDALTEILGHSQSYIKAEIVRLEVPNAGS